MARTPKQLQAAINRGKKGGGTQGALERGEALVERGRMGGGRQGHGEILQGRKLIQSATAGGTQGGGYSAKIKRRGTYKGAS
jgi:hypothetical protein